MKIRRVVAVVVVFLAMALGVPSAAQEPPQCEADYAVEAGDWLSRIADGYYDDYSLYPAIVFATNARAMTDESYASIADPNLIMPGWKLCLPSADDARAGLTLHRLRNTEYKSEWTKSKTAQLAGGYYEEEIVPGSASKIMITLTPHMAFGYLADGREAAAVVLATNAGGSGTFIDLAAVVQQDGKPANVATTLLGDRVRVNSLSIGDGRIVVDMVKQGPNDPMCCPTQRVLQTYAVREDQLVQTSSEVIGAAASLEGPQWRLVSYVDRKGDPVTVIADTHVWIRFQPDQAVGSAGCNNYFGSYEVEGAGLSLGPIGSTMMACADPEGVMKQESDYLAGLEKASGHHIVGDLLRITDAEGKTLLVFQIAEPTSLAGTSWQVRSYNNGKGARVSVLAGTQITAVFGADGSVSGSAGCNTYKASYEAVDGRLTLGLVATTRMMCAEPGGIMDQEQAYLAALGLATTYEVVGDTLELIGADGARAATFARAEGLDIVGVLWKWQKTQTPVGVTVVEESDKYTVKLLPDGKVDVKADCNVAGGTYQIDGSHISIEITVTTLAACPEGSLGDQFIKDLNATVIYFMEDGNLFIDLIYDSGTMEFSQ